MFAYQRRSYCQVAAWLKLVFHLVDIHAKLILSVALQGLQRQDCGLVTLLGNSWSEVVDVFVFDSLGDWCFEGGGHLLDRSELRLIVNLQFLFDELAKCE